MGLKYILDTDFVYLIDKGSIDDFGLSQSTDKKSLLKCYVRGSEDSTPRESKGGKQVIPTYKISFNGKVPVKVGDLLEVEGEQFTVLSKVEQKDLARVVMFTKIVV